MGGLTGSSVGGCIGARGYAPRSRANSGATPITGADTANPTFTSASYGLTAHKVHGHVRGTATSTASDYHVGTPATSHVLAPLTYGYAAEQNARFRNYMEDDHTVLTDVADRHGSLLVGLYDGHGGRAAVDFVTERLHRAVEAELRLAPPAEPPTECLKRAFIKIDRMLLQLGCMHVGTTAASCLFLRSPGPEASLTLHVANAGDSRVVLVATSGATRLSVDHVATDPSEVSAR